MKKTANNLVQDLKNNIGHPLFFDGYDALMRDERKFLKNEVKSDLRKLKRNISQKFGVLIGCVCSFIFTILWLLFVPIYSFAKIMKKMFLIPFKVKEHQKLIEMIKQHPEFAEIESHHKSKQR
jgi:hypothetical protein